ncbi:MAG: hypothetical protein NTX25_16090, partial [Proteobacteria bacterium]|nr:hypothetical protein [Pseudomonadota bacterium]
MKKSLMKTLLLAGCLLAAGRLAYSKFRPVPSHPTQVKATVWQNQAVQASNWQVGHEYLYDFDYTGGGLIAKTSGKNLEYRVQGQLVMAVLYEEGDFFKVWLHLNSENEEGLKTLPVKLRTSLQNSWKTGIFAKLETRGFHWNALTESGQDGAAYQFWQKLAERMRVNLPVEIRSNPWTQDESLASGSLPVRYEIEANLSSNPIQNEKITLRRTLAGIPAKGRKLKLESLVVLFPNFAGLDSLVYQSQEN